MTRGDLIYRMARDANTAANRQAYDAIVSAVEAEDRLSAAQAALEQAADDLRHCREAVRTGGLLRQQAERLLREHVVDLDERLTLEQYPTSLAARTFRALTTPESPPVEADPKEEA